MVDTLDTLNRLSAIIAEDRERSQRLEAACQTGPPDNCAGVGCLGRVEFEGRMLDCPLNKAGCPFSEGRRKAYSASVLSSLGFGSRYQGPVIERVIAAWQAELRAYLDDLESHLRRGFGLLLSGKPGTGKTSVLALVALAAYDAGFSVGYWYSPRLFDALHSRDLETTRHAEQVDLLLLDDFGVQYSGDWAASRFDALIETRYAEQRAVAVSTNAPLRVLGADPQWARVADRWRETCLALETTAESQRKMGMRSVGAREPEAVD